MHDVIVVGAWLTGAATALLLARAGHRVLLLDRADLSGDRTRSAAANLIHPPCVRLLRVWGVLDQLLAGGCPAITRYGLWNSPVGFAAEIPPSGDVRHAYSPPRTRLDAVLLEAALRAGAELRDQASATGLRHDSTGRVNGVTGRMPSGVSFTETCTHSRRVVYRRDVMVGRLLRRSAGNGRGHRRSRGVRRRRLRLRAAALLGPALGRVDAQPGARARRSTCAARRGRHVRAVDVTSRGNQVRNFCWLVAFLRDGEAI